MCDRCDLIINIDVARLMDPARRRAAVVGISGGPNSSFNRRYTTVRLAKPATRIIQALKGPSSVGWYARTTRNAQKLEYLFFERI